MANIVICKSKLHSYDSMRKQCPECHREAVRMYRLNNKDKIKSIDQQYNSVHKEKQKANIANWKKANPGQVNAANNRRRAAKIQATPKWLTEQHLNSMKLYYTAAKWVESILDEKIHVDHIVPLRAKNMSGLHVPWNLQLLLKSDNLKKHNNIK